MALGLPKKILDAIQVDVKKVQKRKGTPWQGFGPVAEAHMSPCSSKAIVVWRQAGHASERTSFMVGVFEKAPEGWTMKSIQPGNYDKDSKEGIEHRIKQEKGAWV